MASAFNLSVVVGAGWRFRGAVAVGTRSARVPSCSAGSDMAETPWRQHQQAAARAPFPVPGEALWPTCWPSAERRAAWRASVTPTTKLPPEPFAARCWPLAVRGHKGSLYVEPNSAEKTAADIRRCANSTGTPHSERSRAASIRKVRRRRDRAPFAICRLPIAVRGSPQGTVPEASRCELAYRGLLHLAGANAAGADPEPPHAAVDTGANSLQIRAPYPFGPVVGMTHVVAHRTMLATNIAASRHDPLLTIRATA